MGSTDETSYTSDGVETFTVSKSVMARWIEYFQKLLNIPGDIETEVLENVQQRSVKTALDEKLTMYEMVKAKRWKAPGGDGSPTIWEEGHVPQTCKDASIVTVTISCYSIFTCLLNMMNPT